METNENLNEFEDFDLASLSELSESLERSQKEEPAEPEERQEEVTPEETNETKENTSKPEEKKDEQEEDKEEPSSQDTNDSPLTPYAKMLVEEGILPNLDIEKFDGTVESFLEAQRQYDQTRFEEFKSSQLDPRVKWLQDNLEDGVPFSDLLDLDRKQLKVGSIEESSLEGNEELQKDIIRAYYQETTSFSEDKIEQLIKRLDTVGELDSESKANLVDLKSILREKEEQERVQAKEYQKQVQQQKQQFQAQFEKTLEDTSEVIPGVKVSEPLKSRIKQTLTQPVAVDEGGNPLNRIAKARAEDPLNFEIKLAYLFEITKGFKDWSLLASAGKKSAIREFEKAISKADTNKQTYKAPRKEDASTLKKFDEFSKFIG